MLEYAKLVLERVSFDSQLFEKELKKSKQWLLKNELKDFEIWCKMNFEKLYPEIIRQCFSGKKK